jgi:hypothetical protein
MTQDPAMPQQPQPKIKKPLYKRKWFLILAALVVLGIFVNAAGGGSDTTTADASPSVDSAITDAAGSDPKPADNTDQAADNADKKADNAKKEADQNPKIGEPAADGKFQFVVNGLDCSATELGSQYLGTKAQGQFCIVDLTVSNTGNKPQSFFGDNAKLFNSEKQEFSADSEAAIYLEDSSSLYEEINPGNTLNSKVVFDVPAGTTPTAIELHDSAFSGGVTVDLQ